MLAPETVLQNRYRIVRPIGQGGMGAVYMATDTRLRSTVALKETFFNADERMRKAFEREAELLANLHHPALPNVSDHFVEGDGQFLVMQFIQGDDLSEMLKQRGRPFSAEEVLKWGDQLLDVLDYLHTQQPPVIHRDIKPQNLKLTARGQVILLDFGLAKGTPSQMSVMTATGSLYGYTPNYAPLEQIQGAGTEPRSDLYSLGATLYHLMTGVTPPDALTRATSLVSEQPDPLRPANEVNPQVPPAVATVLAQAMTQNRNQRPANADAMRKALLESSLAVTVPESAPLIVSAESEAQTVIMPHEAGGTATEQNTDQAEATIMQDAALPGVVTAAVADSARTNLVESSAKTNAPEKVPTPKPETLTAVSPAAAAASKAADGIKATAAIKDAKAATGAAQTSNAATTGKRLNLWRVLIPAAVLLAVVFGSFYALRRRSQSPAPDAQMSPQSNTSVQSVTVGNPNNQTPDALPSPVEQSVTGSNTNVVPQNPQGNSADKKQETARTSNSPAQTKSPTNNRSQAGNNGYYDPAEAQRAQDEARKAQEEARREAEQAQAEARREQMEAEAEARRQQAEGNNPGRRRPQVIDQPNGDGSTTKTIIYPDGRVRRFIVNPDGTIRRADRGGRRQRP